MSFVTRSQSVRLIAIAAGVAFIASAAVAQQRQAPTEQQFNATVNNADQSKHTSQGGTQPGVGTHGHSSATTPSNPGATKNIQDQQHGLPATPPHSSQSLTKP